MRPQGRHDAKATTARSRQPIPVIASLDPDLAGNSPAPTVAFVMRCETLAA